MKIPDAPAIDVDQLTRDLETAQFRLGELQRDLTAEHDRAEQIQRDLEGARHRIGELEYKLPEVERQRDQAAEMAERSDRLPQRAHDRHRAAEAAPTIAALVDLYRVAASGGGPEQARRYLTAAQRLADPLVAAILEE